jgi:hypothetical protein
MASVVSLLMVDIAGLLAALSIWTASFLLLSRAGVSSNSTFHREFATSPQPHRVVSG